MKKFKVGQKIVNNVDYSVGTHHGWCAKVNQPDYEPDGTMGVVMTVIEVDGCDITTDFITEDGDNYWFESDSPFAKDFELVE
jgi:hypothetical protein